MELPNDTSRFHVRQNLRVLERLGTEPELAQALAKALDKNSETGEARAAHTGRHNLDEQLLRAREELATNPRRAGGVKKDRRQIEDKKQEAGAA